MTSIITHWLALNVGVVVGFIIAAMFHSIGGSDDKTNP